MPIDWRRQLLFGASLVVLACSGERAAPPPPAPARPAAPAPPASTPDPVAIEPAPAPAPVTTPTPPAPKPGMDSDSAAKCTADADCGFDDTCIPTRCIAASSTPSAACDESAPAPGTCLCVAGACTLKPKQPPKAEGPCEKRACVLDRAGGRCIADTKGVGEGFRTNSGLSFGPSCDCVVPSRGCTFTWYEAVPCKTDRDCWVAEQPRQHPIKRPAHLRRRDFAPCSDGETAPACSEDGQCVLGLRFRC